MPVALNELLELRLLALKVRLCEKEPSTAAISIIRRTMEVCALCSQWPLFWPHPPFTNDGLHALKPPGHGGVIISVKIPPMVGPTWCRVTYCLLGSDCPIIVSQDLSHGHVVSTYSSCCVLLCLAAHHGLHLMHGVVLVCCFVVSLIDWMCAC